MSGLLKGTQELGVVVTGINTFLTTVFGVLMILYAVVAIVAGPRRVHVRKPAAAAFLAVLLIALSWLYYELAVEFAVVAIFFGVLFLVTLIYQLFAVVSD
jgi:hypothetical protein